MKLKQTILMTALLATFNVTAQAGMIADGDLKDWLNAPAGNSNDWTPTQSNVKYTIDDQSGLDNNGYLSPGYGGQAYDAEAIYLKRDENFFYVAVVTGLSPNTIDYPAGDLAFDFGNDGTYEYGVIVKSDSQFANANNEKNGGIGKQGEVYKVNQWNVGLWDNDGIYVGNGQGTQEDPTTVKSGTKIGNVDLAYTQAMYDGKKILSQLGNYGGTHYVIEAKIPVLIFAATDLAKAFTVHWTMACANDSIAIDPIPSRVPTPATLPLLALGLALLVGYRKELNIA